MNQLINLFKENGIAAWSCCIKYVDDAQKGYDNEFCYAYGIFSRKTDGTIKDYKWKTGTVENW